MSKSLLTIGITGGIGSGKTTVCRLFETLGVPVYYADDKAKWLMQTDASLIQSLKDTFGPATYDKDGQLDRKHLAGIVFNDKEKLAQLNALVHPAVGMDGLRWTAEMTAQGHAYALREAALLFESGSYKTCDKVVVVTAPEGVRIQRVISRDNSTEEQVRARINKQWSQDKKIELADIAIANDGKRSLIAQVWKLHQTFCKLSANLSA